MRKSIALALLVLPWLCVAARADDSGPPRDVRQVRSDAVRLLAHRERGLGLEPKNTAVVDVVVSGNEAIASWDNARDHGVIGLLRRENRWWDAYQAAGAPASVTQLKSAGFTDALLAPARAHNADIRAATAQEKPVVPVADHACSVPCAQTGGYGVSLHLAPNDALSKVATTFLYARAPTHAEFLPNPPPPKDWGGSTDVGYFDFDIGGTQPVTFTAGTTADIWFPFVLDDTLRYDVSIFSGGKAVGPYHGTLFDNVLHFVLPPFTVVPGKGFQAEISGWY
ncbi:MAG TPA: hypothetical protein VIO32_07610 [Candidatus Baltobacteraceae bacterium]